MALIDRPRDHENIRPWQRSSEAFRAVLSVLGASFLGHGISVNRDRPVAVVKARNAVPWGLSESKSMISR
jgi:hypothetical protein